MYEKLPQFPWLTPEELKLYYTLPPWPEYVMPQDITVARRLGRTAGGSMIKFKYPQLTDNELRRIVMLWNPNSAVVATGVFVTPMHNEPTSRLFKLCANLAGASFADIARLYGVRTSTIIQSVNGLMPTAARNALKEIIAQRMDNKVPKVDLSRLIEMKTFFDALAQDFKVSEKQNPEAIALALINCPTDLNEAGDESQLEQQMFGGEAIPELTQQQIREVVAAARQSSLADVEEDFKDDEDY